LVDRIAKNLTSQMLEQGIIYSVDLELYVYRFTVILETLFSLVSLTVIALIVRRADVMAVLVSSFAMLRSRSGGFHFDTYLLCYLGTLVLFTTLSFIIPFLHLSIPMLAVCGCAALMIAFMGFINHPELDLEGCAVRKKKKQTCLVLSAELGAVLILKLTGRFEVYAVCIAVAVILDFMLMITAKLFGQEVRTNGGKN